MSKNLRSSSKKTLLAELRKESLVRLLKKKKIKKYKNFLHIRLDYSK